MSDDTPKLKFCKDCKYCAVSNSIFYYCHHERATELNMVTGNEVHYPCDEMRNGACGSEAKLFEPKEQGA